MSAPDIRPIHLASDVQRQFATAAIWRAPDFWYVTIKPPTRTLDQNAKIHAILSDIVKAKLKWAEQEWDIEGWKALTVAGFLHVVYGESNGPPMVPGIDGGPVQLRRSTTTFSVKEGAAYIEYLTAFAAQRGIKLSKARNHTPA